MGDFYQTTANNIKVYYADKAQKTDKDIKEEIALQLKLYREEHKLTLEQLAEKVGVSKMQIIRWEAMRSKPHQIVMEKLRALKILYFFTLNSNICNNIVYQVRR